MFFTKLLHVHSRHCAGGRGGGIGRPAQVLERAAASRYFVGAPLFAGHVKVNADLKKLRHFFCFISIMIQIINFFWTYHHFFFILFSNRFLFLNNAVGDGVTHFGALHKGVKGFNVFGQTRAAKRHLAVGAGHLGVLRVNPLVAVV